MIDFTKNSTKVGGPTSDNIPPGKEKVKIKLVLKDRIEELVLTLINIFYFSHSPSNLVSLNLLNDAEIYHYNKDQILYKLKIEKTLAFAKQYKTSFFLHPRNLSAAAVNLLKNNRVYNGEKPNVNQT